MFYGVLYGELINNFMELSGVHKNNKLWMLKTEIFFSILMRYSFLFILFPSSTSTSLNCM